MLPMRRFREARRMLGWNADRMSATANVPAAVVYEAEIGGGRGSISLFHAVRIQAHASAPAFASAKTARFSGHSQGANLMTGHIPRNYAPRNGSTRAKAEAAFRKFTAKADAKDQSAGRNLKAAGTPLDIVQAAKKD